MIIQIIKISKTKVHRVVETIQKEEETNINIFDKLDSAKDGISEIKKIKPTTEQIFKIGKVNNINKTRNPSVITVKDKEESSKIRKANIIYETKEKNIIPDPIRVPICLWNGDEFSIMSLIDTGSDRSFINTSIFEKLGEYTTIYDPMSVEFADGSKREIKRIKIKIKLTNEIEFKDFVVGILDSKEEFILGRDGMKLFNIFCPLETIIWGTDFKKTYDKIIVNDSQEVYIKERNELMKSIQKNIIINDSLHGFAKFDPIKIRINDHLMKNGAWIEPFKIKSNVFAKVEKQIFESLESGILIEVKEKLDEIKFNSPLVIVEKPDGSIRLTQDYRLINPGIINTSNLLPNISNIIEVIGNSNARIFSKMDLKSAYNQVAIHQDSIKITAFTFNHSDGSQIRYAWKCLPFGITNIPSMFQSCIQSIIKDIINVKNFLDDIIIFSSNVDDHIKTVNQVLDRLNKFNFKLNKKNASSS